jgi:hypothetical protein
VLVRSSLLLLVGWLGWVGLLLGWLVGWLALAQCKPDRSIFWASKRLQVDWGQIFRANAYSRLAYVSSNSLGFPQGLLEDCSLGCEFGLLGCEEKANPCVTCDMRRATNRCPRSVGNFAFQNRQNRHFVDTYYCPATASRNVLAPFVD